MNLAARPSVTLIAGRSGFGKSTFALRYLVNTADFSGPVACRWLFDPRGEYEARLKIPACRSALDIELAVRRGWLLYDPGAFRPGDHAAAFADFCDLAMCLGAAQRGRKIILIDEVWKYCTPRSIPEELSALILEGRKFQIETVFVTQRPNLVNEAILGEATESVAFALQGENGIEKLTRYGFTEEEILALPAFAFIARNDLGGRQLGHVTA